jgi:uncharacterized membrane protein (DUF485 family)
VYFDNDPDMLNIAVDDHWHDLLSWKLAFELMFSLEVSTACFSFILIIEFQPLFLSKKSKKFQKIALIF